MFRLVRNFSYASGVALAASSSLLVYSFHDRAQTNLLQSAQSQNVLMAQAVGNALELDYSLNLMKALGVKGKQALPDVETMEGIVHAAVSNTPILTLTIYDINGMKIFPVAAIQKEGIVNETARRLLTTDQATPESLIRFGDESSPHGLFAARSVVSTFVPILHQGTKIGVIDIHADVSRQVEEERLAIVDLGVALASIFSGLFIAIFLIGRRGEQTFDQQRSEIAAVGKSLEDTKRLLFEETRLRGVAEDSLRKAGELLSALAGTHAWSLEEFDIRALLEGLLSDLIRFTETEAGLVGISRMDQEGRSYLQVSAIRGFEATSRLEFSDNLVSVSLGEGKVTIIKDLALLDSPSVSLQGESSLRNWMALPLRRGSRTVGLLALANRDGGFDVRMEEGLAPLLAAMAALLEINRLLEETSLGRKELLERANRGENIARVAEEQARNARAEQETVAALLALALKNAPIEDILDDFLKTLLASRAMGSGAAGAVYLLNENSGELILASGLGLPQSFLETFDRKPIGKGMCGQAAECRDITFAQTVDAEVATCFPDVESPAEHCIPLRGGEGLRGILGVLDLYFPHGHRRTEEADAFLTSVADILSGILSAARVEDTLSQTLEEFDMKVETRTRELDDKVIALEAELTRLDATREEAERDRRTKIEFLVGMSHALRTSANAISGFAENLLNQTFAEYDGHRHREYVGFIHETARKMILHIQEALDLAEAEGRGGEINPDNAVALGSFASFSVHIHRTQELAEALFQRALKTSPGNPVLLSSYALFRNSIRSDYEKAEALYLQIIDQDPENVVHLGNYAVFLADIRKHHDRAEAIYKRAIAADPDYAPNLGNYAVFLARVRGNNDRADEFFRLASTADPTDVSILTNYAMFLKDCHKDDVQAGVIFSRAVAVAPGDPMVRMAYATFLLSGGDFAKGESLLDQSIAQFEGDELLQGLYFRYAYASSGVRQAEALNRIHELLEDNVRCPGFDPSRDIQHLIEAGTSEPEFLISLAQVIACRETMETLNRFPAWMVFGGKQFPTKHPLN